MVEKQYNLALENSDSFVSDNEIINQLCRDNTMVEACRNQCFGDCDIVVELYDQYIYPNDLDDDEDVDDWVWDGPIGYPLFVCGTVDEYNESLAKVIKQP